MYFYTTVLGIDFLRVRFELNGGYAKRHNDFQVMMSRMYERQWCPSVLAEYDSLYAKDGIASVAEADKAGYDMPTVIWVRDSSNLEGRYSSDPIYKEVHQRVFATCAPAPEWIRVHALCVCIGLARSVSFLLLICAWFLSCLCEMWRMLVCRTVAMCLLSLPQNRPEVKLPPKDPTQARVSVQQSWQPGSPLPLPRSPVPPWRPPSLPFHRLQLPADKAIIASMVVTPQKTLTVRSATCHGMI